MDFSKTINLVATTTDEDLKKELQKLLQFTGKLLSFKISDVFGNRNPFVEQNLTRYYWSTKQNTIIIIPSHMPKLIDYILPKTMHNSEIQTITKSTPMDECIFWAVLYLLIIKPELGKELLGYELSKSDNYIFHVKMKIGDAYAVNVRWNGDVWDCSMWKNSFEFNDIDHWWGQGRKFVSFAIE